VIPDTGEEIRQLAVIGDRLYADYVIEGEPVIRIWIFPGKHLGELPIDKKVTPQLCPAYSQNADASSTSQSPFTSLRTSSVITPKDQSSELVFRKDTRSAESYE
jgi:hypothetical protein